MNFLLFVC